MSIVFLGSGEFGLPTLRALADAGRIAAVVSQPDRPAGRGGKLTPTPVSQFAIERNLPLIRPERINDPAAAAAVRAHNADAWVVIAFGQKLGRELLDRTVAINLHASLLPRWRGAAPINAAILAGDPTTGNSIITLADRMDAGDILAQSERPLDPALTAGELHDILSADGPALVDQVLAAHTAGTLRPRRQEEALVTVAPKLSKADGRVDWSAPADHCRRRIHGLTPWPGITARLGPHEIKLRRAVPEEGGGEPGVLLDAEAGTIACGAGTALRLLEVQPAGGRPMSWPEFARGRRPAAGLRIESIGC